MTTGLNYVLHPLTRATRPYLLLLYICKNGVWYLLSYEWYLPRQAVYIQVEVAYNLAGVCRCVSQVSFSVPHQYPRDGWWRPVQWPAWSCPHCRGHHQHLHTVRQSDIKPFSNRQIWRENVKSFSGVLMHVESLPSICTKSSDFTLRLASCSLSEPLLLPMESISSMKMVLGA